METLYFAGGCLWGVQAYIKTLPGVLVTEAGRANGATGRLETSYVASAEEHQDHLDKYPHDYCHIPKELMTKYVC